MAYTWPIFICRFAIYASLINIIIVSVLLLRQNNCVFIDCEVNSMDHQDDAKDECWSNADSATCYDNDSVQPALNDDEVGQRRYNCRPPQFSDVPLAATALACSAGSGSTWLRHLLQKATGIYTGSVYYDDDLAKSDFPGENVTNSRVIVIKTHRERELRNYDRAILLIRDPYNAIVSEYNWRVCGNHLGRAQSHVYNTTAWRQFVDQAAEHWHRFNSQWLNDFQGPLHVIFYEDMVEDLTMTMRDVLAFLDMPGTRVYCALRSPDGNFKRKPTNVASRQLYTLEQRATIDGYQETVYEDITQQQERLRARMLS